MDWTWLVREGLIVGDPNYYASGKATADEYARAVRVAYLNANDTQRRTLVDMLWATGEFGGDASYWYTARPDEVGDLENAAMGLAPQMGTGDEADPRFGVAGGAKLWKNTTTGEVWIVYQVPGTEGDPVYLRWRVPSPDDVQSFFGPDQPVVYDRQIAGDDAAWADALDFGSSDEIANTSRNPFDGWASTMEVEAASQPWLLDDDYQKILAMAIIEGREITEAELQSTNWFKTHSEAERDWMVTFHGDPATAEQMLADGRISQQARMQELGMSMPNEGLVTYMADMVTKGHWSQDYFEQQVRALSDSYYSDVPIDGGLRSYMEDNGISVDTNDDMENEVRTIVTRWLGTNFGSWDDDTVAEWAARLRNETDGADKLVELLKDQKSALFPMYDREADYASISAPWKTMVRNIWGEVPQDSDQTLHNIIRMNDATEAGKYLTREGLQRGNKMVAGTVQQALNRAFGGMVR